MPRGPSVTETIAAVREQGGLIGVPHPFDRYRGSLLQALAEPLRAPVDWIEVHNARVMVGDGNARQPPTPRRARPAGVAVSDAHSVLEVGVAYTALDGDPCTPAGLMAALPTAELVTGRASYSCASSRRWPRSSSGCAAIAAWSPRETRRERPDTGPSTDGGRVTSGVASDQMDLTAPAPQSLLSRPARRRRPTRPTRSAVDPPRRLLQPRTILSIAVPLVIAIFFWLNGDRLVEVPALLLQADWRYVSLAFGIFTWARCAAIAGSSCCGAPASTCRRAI